MKNEQIAAVRCKCGRPAHIWHSRDGYLCGCINPDCKITFPEKIPVAYNFDMDEIIGHADISKVEDGLKGVVSLFDTNILPGNEYFVGGYYTRIKTHVEDHITVVDSGRLVSMSIIPEHNVADENLKVRRVEPNAEN